MMQYVVHDPFLAVRDEPPHQFTFVTLEPGVTLIVKGEPQRSGLVDIEYKGRIVAAFMRDILTHCERVEAKAR